MRNAFIKLGQELSNISSQEIEKLADEAKRQNSWFTTQSVKSAYRGIASMLQQDRFDSWFNNYSIHNQNPKNVAVIMAGNIPMVGFHDYMMVLLSGNHLWAKLSAQDTILMLDLHQRLINIDPSIQSAVKFVQQIKGADAIIATGSDNSARYFEYYFKNIPHIIRKNRIAIAVIDDQWTAAELKALGYDIFTYYGLGCRNVAKLFLKKGFDLLKLMDQLQPFQLVMEHHKYLNNYDYNKSILLVNRVKHYDTGFLLLHESKEMVSPIAVLYYEFYEDEDALRRKLLEIDEQIQCVISKNQSFQRTVAPSKAQLPQIGDFADGVDTLDFLIKNL